jgi:acyl transferase domain-containing protein/SAM-dependent methyltransferase
VTELTPVKRALLEIRELRTRLAELERASQEPIAIIGIGIRTSGGVHDAASFAELLWAGRDAITPIPATRWPIDDWYDEAQDTPGKMITRFGGFIDDVDRFDAEFFGISPREAASMDPQQRLVLELAWQALEDAGHAPAQLTGTKAGIYLGIANGDYGRALFANPQLIDPYFSSGNAYSVAAGRLSYLLGVHGPAIALDTACSSSLVALHLACQGLRQGECDLALVGGINLILTPEFNITFSKAGMMSRDGRCKTFDAAADGYVRGEGGAIVVLRRLRDAQVDGDRVLALIRGSAVNQDGRSNGLTAPNGPAQEAVLRAALQAARVQPASVGYIEAHGTGTSLGDPIEVKALAAVLSEGRDAAQPLAIGSVKTNVGHLEAAAGIVGLVKAVLALQRGEIPPHLHLQQRNPYIAWDSIPIVVPTVTTPWAPIGGRRVAGVSSFGFSGTNAHVILEEAPAEAVRSPDGAQRDVHVLALSARDSRALSALVGSYALLLSSTAATDIALGDLCFTANAGRSHFAHRVSVVGASAREMAAALEAFQRGEPHPGVVSGVAGAAPPCIAFLFPGQGPQYVGMGRELYDGAPAFREAFDRCAGLLDELLPQPIRSVVFASSGATTLLDDTAFAQPAMFAIEFALASLWRSWGVDPAAVMGHSFGEYTAACVAGALSLADAARMVAVRGRLVQALPRDGAMSVIEASEDAVRAALEKQRGRVAIAAVNGPANTVISGERVAVETLAAQFAASGARVKALRVSHAFHSQLMDPVLDSFEREVSGVRFAAPQMTLISNLSGQLADLGLIGRPGYWREHMREAVRFADSMRTLATQGITHYIEMSPQPVLLGMGSECVQGGAWLPSLREGKPAWPVLLQSLQTLYCAGAEIDWQGLDRGIPRRRVALPTYPFQRKRHWIDVVGASAQAAGLSALERWQRVTQALDRHAQRGPLDLNVATYPAKWHCLARLTAAHAVQTLREGRLFIQPAERRSIDEVMAVAGIVGIYRHLVQRWLDRLTAQNVLRREADNYVADAPLSDPGLPALWHEAEELFADNQPLLAYVRHCGNLLGAVLTGKESPLETLFPGGSFELAEGLYQRSATMRYINDLASTAFEALAETIAPGRRLRVMEVGAGTGSTTAALLPVLPRDQTRYCYTDMSISFFEQARKRFASYSFIEYGLFDMEQDPVTQGYALQSFDVIVSANAVHASTDLRTALRRLHSLLAPGGVLILVESTIHHDWFDMTTGLIEGWQQFADDLRTDNPLLSPRKWIGALEEAGFQAAGAWPQDGSPAEILGQHVILARVPGDAAAAISAVDSTAAFAAAQNEVIPESAPQLQGWRERLDQTLSGERLSLLQELVCAQVMHVLRLDPTSRPARHDRLMELGMDSLMAVQLRNALGTALALERPLPSTLMFDYPTIDAIAAFLLDRLMPSAAPAGTTSASALAPAPAAAPAARGAAAVAAMSDDEIAKLLIEQLGAS